MRDNSETERTKPAGRSLRPPPSLAARYAGADPASAPATSNRAPTDDEKAALREIAKELREILNLMDESDAQLTTDRTKK